MCSHVVQVLRGVPGVPRVLMLGRASGNRVLVTDVVGVPLNRARLSQQQLQSLWPCAFNLVERIHK